MNSRESSQRKWWLLAFVALQVLALWQGFGSWLLSPERTHAP